MLVLLSKLYSKIQLHLNIIKEFHIFKDEILPINTICLVSSNIHTCQIIANGSQEQVVPQDKITSPRYMDPQRNINDIIPLQV